MEKPAQITRDQFLAWRADPLTTWVMEALSAQAAAQKAEWDRVAWVGAHFDAALGQELRVRADTFQSVIEADYGALCGALGETAEE